MLPISLFIDFPFASGLGESLPAIERTGLFSMHTLRLDADLVPLIVEARPCVCMFSVRDELSANGIVEQLELLRDTRLVRGGEARDPSLRIVLLLEDRSVPVERWTDLGAHELIIAPVLPRAIAFKLARHYQKAQMPVVPELGAESALTEDLPQEAAVGERRQRVFRVPKGKPGRAASASSSVPTENHVEKYIVRANLAEVRPGSGEWRMRNSQGGFEDTWEWHAHGDVDHLERSERRRSERWTFSGDRPVLDESTKQWVFQGEAPALLCETDDGRRFSAIQTHGKDRSLQVAATDKVDVKSVHCISDTDRLAARLEALSTTPPEEARQLAERIIHFLEHWRPGTELPLGDGSELMAESPAWRQLIESQQVEAQFQPLDQQGNREKLNEQVGSGSGRVGSGQSGDPSDNEPPALKSKGQEQDKPLFLSDPEAMRDRPRKPYGSLSDEIAQARSEIERLLSGGAVETESGERQPLEGAEKFDQKKAVAGRFAKATGQAHLNEVAPSGRVDLDTNVSVEGSGIALPQCREAASGERVRDGDQAEEANQSRSDETIGSPLLKDAGISSSTSYQDEHARGRGLGLDQRAEDSRLADRPGDTSSESTGVAAGPADSDDLVARASEDGQKQKAYSDKTAQGKSSESGAWSIQTSDSLDENVQLARLSKFAPSAADVARLKQDLEALGLLSNEGRDPEKPLDPDTERRVQEELRKLMTTYQRSGSSSVGYYEHRDKSWLQRFLRMVGSLLRKMFE